ncbi:MAG: class B sortase [Lachnospiraceae bacterium]|nr:class B sortase [Lachnospiraceae bacterium]
MADFEEKNEVKDGAASFEEAASSSSFETPRRFVIGEFSFDSFHEYRDGQEDLKKISVIQNNLDVSDPETAVKIYKALRNGQIVFRSPIGEQFAQHITDIVAEKSKGLIDDKKIVDDAEKRTGWTRWLGIALACVAAFLFVYFLGQELIEVNAARKAEALRKQVAESIAKGGYSNVNYGEQSNGGSTGTNGTASQGNENAGLINGEGGSETRVTNIYGQNIRVDRSSLTVLPDYSELYAQNPDTAGWLTIPDTGVDYVVVQGSDNDYYLRRDFYGNSDSNGTLFVDYRCDIVNPTTNTIIYGHDMNSGMMFGTLSRYYEDVNFYRSHRTVNFSTIYEHRTYEIVAVCLSEVKYQDDSSYRYYNFINAGNEAEWNAFVNNVRDLTLYPEDLTLAPGDQVLTLSTCDDYKDNGRLFIVARRVR